MSLMCNMYDSNEEGASRVLITEDGEIGWKLVVDVVIVLVVATPIAVFKWAVTPYHRGYFCDDDSIRYNFKPSTIPSLALYLVGTIVPGAAFLIIEFVRFKRGRLPNASHKYTVFGFPVHALFISLFRTFYFFAFACVCSQTLTDIGKYTIGRLRPNFLDVCRSNMPCGTSSVADPHVYILDYQCTGPANNVKDSRLSFPSGHSSFSAVTMVYLVLFLQARLNTQDCRLLRPFLQFLCIVITFYTGLSRVSDNKHHWSDVLTGFALGTTVAVLVACYVSDLFPRKRHNKDEMTVIPLADRVDM